MRCTINKMDESQLHTVKEAFDWFDFDQDEVIW